MIKIRSVGEYVLYNALDKDGYLYIAYAHSEDEAIKLLLSPNK